MLGVGILPCMNDWFYVGFVLCVESWNLLPTMFVEFWKLDLNYEFFICVIINVLLCLLNVWNGWMLDLSCIKNKLFCYVYSKWAAHLIVYLSFMEQPIYTPLNYRAHDGHTHAHSCMAYMGMSIGILSGWPHATSSQILILSRSEN